MDGKLSLKILLAVVLVSLPLIDAANANWNGHHQHHAPSHGHAEAHSHSNHHATPSQTYSQQRDRPGFMSHQTHTHMQAAPAALPNANNNSVGWKLQGKTTTATKLFQHSAKCRFPAIIHVILKVESDFLTAI